MQVASKELHMNVDHTTRARQHVLIQGTIHMYVCTR